MKRLALRNRVKCGCWHDNVFWTKYCAYHQKELEATRAHWAAFYKRMLKRKA